MGKAMWLEYFLTISCRRQELAYCAPSSLKWMRTVVPAVERALVADGLFDLEAGLAVGGPLEGLVFAGLAGEDLDLVGDHEDGVEADAELSDEVGVFPGVAGELGEEVLGAGAGDGAEVRDEVFLVHADAGVGDGEGLVGFVELEVDARRVDAVADERFVPVVDEGEVTELVERVGGVGDELAEEDLRVGVQRMDD